MSICRDLYQFLFCHKDDLIKKTEDRFLKLGKDLIRNHQCKPPCEPQCEPWCESLCKAEDFPRFYEPILEDKELNFFLKKLSDREKPAKYFLTGHRGVGKTMVINKIAQLAQNSFCVVTGSVKPLMSETDPDHRDILYFIGFLLAEKLVSLSAEHPGLEVLPVLRELSRIAGEESRATHPKDILKQIYKIQEDMGLQEVYRGTKRTCIENKQQKLLECIDQLHSLIEYCTNKPLLVIIDDLDKIDVNLRQVYPEKAPSKLPIDAALFYKYRRQLCAPKFHIIYTLPFSLFYSDFFIQLKHYYNDELVVPVVNVIGQNRIKNGKGINKFEKLINRRIDSSAFDKRVLSDLICYSGGNIRILLDLVYRCCMYVAKNPRIPKLWGMTYGGREKIDWETLDNVVHTYQIDIYRLLTTENRAQLRKLSGTGEPDNIKPQALSFFIKENYALEQRTPDIWFLVPPLVQAAINIGADHD